jgi:hypothetical protein
MLLSSQNGTLVQNKISHEIDIKSALAYFLQWNPPYGKIDLMPS